MLRGAIELNFFQPLVQTVNIRICRAAEDEVSVVIKQPLGQSRRVLSVQDYYFVLCEVGCLNVVEVLFVEERSKVLIHGGDVISSPSTITEATRRARTRKESKESSLRKS
jgi:hypothetical protein